MDKRENLNKGEIIIYQTSKNEVDLKVRLEDETIWLDARQVATVFGVDRTGVVRHANNIYKTNELDEKSTCAKIAQVAKDGKVREVNLYSLDMILSIGYRVNSKKATEFRKWATTILKSHIIKGYTLNKKRLAEAENKFRELQKTVNFLQAKSKSKNLRGQESEILNILNDYSKTLTLLEEYDRGKLKKRKSKKEKTKLSYSASLSAVAEIKKSLIAKKEASEIFGNLKDNGFEAVVKGVYQTYGGKELYPGLSLKAANLIYLIIKNHPFSDGNKRIASFLFVYFLDLNSFLYRDSGERKINDNALATLALLIAESDPKEKETMIKLITNLIS